MKIKNLAIMFSVFLFIGCASTKITSFKDPSYATKTFNKITVVAPFKDIESRTKAETIFSKMISAQGIEGIPSIHVLLPTRKYDSQEIIKIFYDNHIDGVLMITLTDAYKDQTYVPQSYSTTQGYGNVIGNTIYYSGTTQSFGGYYISKPRVKYDMRLYDVKTGETAWVASSFTKGNAFATFNTLIESLAHTAIEKLKQDGLLK